MGGGSARLLLGPGERAPSQLPIRAQCTVHSAYQLDYQGIAEAWLAAGRWRW